VEGSGEDGRKGGVREGKREKVFFFKIKRINEKEEKKIEGNVLFPIKSHPLLPLPSLSRS